MPNERMRLSGRFTVKEGSGDRPFLLYDAGPGPMVIIELWRGFSLLEAHRIAKLINGAADEVVLDFSYSPATKLGFGHPA
jgi:hypothetical protein